MTLQLCNSLHCGLPAGIAMQVATHYDVVSDS